jgi:hypothetical protein
MSETFYKLPPPYNNYLGRFKSTNADRTDKKIPNIFYFDFGRIDIIGNYLNYMYGDYNENRNSTLADEWVQLLRIKKTDKQHVNPKKPEKSIVVYYQLKNRGDSGGVGGSSKGPFNAGADAGGGGDSSQGPFNSGAVAGVGGDPSQGPYNAGAVAGGGGDSSQGHFNAGADGGPNNFSSSSLNVRKIVPIKPSISPSIIFDKSFSDPDKNTLTRIIEKLREKGILPNKRENKSPPISVSTYPPTSGYTYRPRLGSPTTFGSLPTACDNLVDFSTTINSRNAVAVIDK